MVVWVNILVCHTLCRYSFSCMYLKIFPYLLFVCSNLFIGLYTTVVLLPHATQSNKRYKKEIMCVGVSVVGRRHWGHELSIINVNARTEENWRGGIFCLFSIGCQYKLFIILISVSGGKKNHRSTLCFNMGTWWWWWEHFTNVTKCMCVCCVASGYNEVYW